MSMTYHVEVKCGPRAAWKRSKSFATTEQLSTAINWCRDCDEDRIFPPNFRVVDADGIVRMTCAMWLDLHKAVIAEAAAWALHFNVSDETSIAARITLMRANIEAGYLEPLLPFLQQFMAMKAAKKRTRKSIRA